MHTTKKTILVTGANGFIARETVRHLCEKQKIVFTTMRHAKGDALELDFEDPAFPSKLNLLPKIDVIVHLAARVDFGTNATAVLFNTNIMATAALLAAAKKWDAHFIFASSALIAGLGAGQINTGSPETPDTPYTKTKWLGEQLIQASGVRSTVLRMGGVFGLDGPEHLGLNRAICTVLEGQVPVQIGVGMAKRNYIYVKDVAAIIEETINQEIYGMHLVAGSEVITIAEMLKVLCGIFMPGRNPEQHEGSQAADQVIIPSNSFTPSRSFYAAASDMYAMTRL